MEAKILQEKHLTRVKVECACEGFFPCARCSKSDGDPQELLENRRKRLLAQFRFKPIAFWPALMGHNDECCPRIKYGTHRRKNRPNALGIHNNAMLQRNIEPRPQEHTLPLHIRLIQCPVALHVR